MRKRVLIVDDVRATRMVLSKMVKQLIPDCTIEEAADGEQALNSYFASEPDIVFLDAVIPTVDGWEVLQCLREIDNDLKVIMVTSSDDYDSVLRAYGLGATEFVGKPFRRKEIAEALELPGSLWSQACA